MHSLTKTVFMSVAAIAVATVHAAPFADGPEDTTEIRSEPIAGLYNNPWYSYLADIREAEQELGSDLRGAKVRGQPRLVHTDVGFAFGIAA